MTSLWYMTSNMKVLSAVLGCISLLALQACSSTGEELSAEGTLRVLPIEVKTEADVEPLSTRAVDEALQVDIMQGSTVIRTYDAGSSELNGLISLPVGNYTLYAHSLQMQEAANDELGSPTYTVSCDFKIVADKTTTLGNLEATQSNVGVLLQYQEQFMDLFTSLSCTLSSPSTGRRVTISGTENRDLTYFHVPANGTLQYTFEATNQDGESFRSPVKTISVTEAKNVYVLVNWD